MSNLRSTLGRVLHGISERINIPAFVLAATMLCTGTVWAQTLSVLHSFNGTDGAWVYGGVTLRGTGNLYGTTYTGGVNNYGNVFNLKYKNSTWIFTPLYSFAGGTDGGNPSSPVSFNPSGVLFSQTSSPTTLFKLMPPGTNCQTAPCSWTETVISTQLGSDCFVFNCGAPLLFDSSGDIYGASGWDIFELVPSGSGWTENVLYTFSGNMQPNPGLVFDGSGNLWGTTPGGGTGGSCSGGCGTVFELVHSGGSWTETTIYNFQGGSDGSGPQSGVTIDSSGNLFGTTPHSIFELSSGVGGGWTFTTLYDIPGTCAGVFAPLVIDGTGTLYDTTLECGAHSSGTIFKLTPSGGGWSYSLLYTFTGGSDGAVPLGSLAIDASGDLFGGTQYGGTSGGACGIAGCGVVWELAP